MILCSHESCPIERRRKAMEHWRAEQIKNGAAKSFATNDYVLSCDACGKNKSWRRFEDGTEREILKESANG